jgi:Cu/Zn superoxide dismutase
LIHSLSLHLDRFPFHGTLFHRSAIPLCPNVNPDLWGIISLRISWVVSVLGVLAYSAFNSQPVKAVVSLHPRAVIQQTNLQHVPHGNAELVWNAKQGILTVTVSLSGMAPGSKHPMHIHNGSCETGDQGIAHALSTVTADNGGQGSSTTTIEQVNMGIPASGWFINVHNSPSLATNLQMRAIACGDITNFNTSTRTNQIVDLALGPTKDTNQAANGVATLSLSSGQLTVTLIVSGLQPGSTHQAHIHDDGSCSNQGPVLYWLNPVQVNQNGIGTSTTVISNVNSIQSGWYVNVHQSPTKAGLSIQTGFEPLVCGDVTPPQ